MKPISVLIDLDRLKDLNTGLGQVAEFFGDEISKIKDENFRFTLLVPAKFKGYFGNSVDYEVVSLKRRYFPSLCRKYDLWYTIHQDSFYSNNQRFEFSWRKISCQGKGKAENIAEKGGPCNCDHCNLQVHRTCSARKPQCRGNTHSGDLLWGKGQDI